MAPKKPNAFILFTADWQKKNAPDLNFQKCIARCGNIWKEMPESERQVYKDLAKDGGVKPPPPPAIKAKPQFKPKLKKEVTSFAAIADAELGNEAQKMLLKEQATRQMKRFIESTVRASSRNHELEKKKYYFIQCNYFDESYNGEFYVPAEFAISEFSLEQGVTRVHHELVNPGFVVFRNLYDAQQSCERTHRLPLPPSARGESDLSKVYSGILDFIRYKEGNDYPPLYTTDDSMKIVESSLAFLKENVDIDCKPLRIFSTQYLFTVLKEETSLMGEMGKPSHTNFNDLLDKDMYEYAPGISCSFHEELDLSKYCARSLAVRYSFMFCKEMCSDIAISLRPGFHVPDKNSSDFIVSDPDNEKQISRPAYAGCAGICGDDIEIIGESNPPRRRYINPVAYKRQGNIGLETYDPWEDYKEERKSRAVSIDADEKLAEDTFENNHSRKLRRSRSLSQQSNQYSSYGNHDEQNARNQDSDDLYDYDNIDRHFKNSDNDRRRSNSPFLNRDRSPPCARYDRSSSPQFRNNSASQYKRSASPDFKRSNPALHRRNENFTSRRYDSPPHRRSDSPDFESAHNNFNDMPHFRSKPSTKWTPQPMARRHTSPLFNRDRYENWNADESDRFSGVIDRDPRKTQNTMPKWSKDEDFRRNERDDLGQGPPMNAFNGRNQMNRSQMNQNQMNQNHTNQNQMIPDQFFGAQNHMPSNRSFGPFGGANQQQEGRSPNTFGTSGAQIPPSVEFSSPNNFGNPSGQFSNSNNFCNPNSFGGPDFSRNCTGPERNPLGKQTAGYSYAPFTGPDTSIRSNESRPNAFGGFNRNWNSNNVGPMNMPVSQFGFNANPNFNNNFNNMRNMGGGNNYNSNMQNTPSLNNEQELFNHLAPLLKNMARQNMPMRRN